MVFQEKDRIAIQQRLAAMTAPVKLKRKSNSSAESWTLFSKRWFERVSRRIDPSCSYS